MAMAIGAKLTAGHVNQAGGGVMRVEKVGAGGALPPWQEAGSTLTASPMNPKASQAATHTGARGHGSAGS